jgi:pSer/pThr/pTyr-binding forkhead associated (FHA) protein
MQVTLEMLTGADAGKRVVLNPGGTVKVGRIAEANLVVHDPMVSNLHFHLECTETSCRLKDLNSRFGTLVNNVKVAEAELKDGDTITAGQTNFKVRMVGAGAATIAAPTGPREDMPKAAATPRAAAVVPVEIRKKAVLDHLRALKEPLFGVFDAARDPKVLEVISNAKEEHQSLFEGPRGEILALWAPYLVALPPQSATLETLVNEGWGKAWGIYLTSPLPFERVRNHLRHFLTVRGEEGEDLLFRFYDPRVLRAFLPVCTPEEIVALFGPIKKFLLESRHQGVLLNFMASDRGELQKTEAAK